MNEERIHGLDYLRGLCALGVMCFHFMPNSQENYSTNSLLVRIGIYGVAVFYVLSGLTLYTVYINKLTLSKSTLLHYFTKRIFRIFPLLWVVTFLYLLLRFQPFEIERLIFNLTGLFAFATWSEVIATGVWSVGNELVFYSLFPFLLWTLKNKKNVFFMLIFLSVTLFIFFSFHVINTQKNLWNQWNQYTNPLNHLLFFVSGICIGFFLEKTSISPRTNFLILLLTLFIFAFFPVYGNTIQLVSGGNRILFFTLSLLVSVCFYKLSISLPYYIHKPLSILGEMSYAVYLLHPLTYLFLKYYFSISNMSLLVLLSLIFTLAGSYFSYYYFEKKMIAFAKKN